MSQWYIIRVVGARERHVAGELSRGLGLRTYYPVEKFKITRRAKTIKKALPLIPTYIFASCRYEMPWRDIAATKDVIDWRKMAGSDVPYVLGDDKVDLIRTMEREYNDAKEDRRKFKPGDRARLTKGPFESMDVLLCTVNGPHATIEVPMLGSTRTAQIRLSDLAPVA